MHFSVMVPVKIPVITDEAIERAKQATLYIDAITRAQNLEEESLASFVREHNVQYARSVSTPFSAAVDAAVSEVMEPYSQDTEDPRYRIFEDETENLKAQFEVATVECIQHGAKYYHKHKLHGFKVCEDGIVREVTPSGQEFLSDKAKQMQVVTISAKEFYKTFRKFANERSDYNAERKAWGYYINPNCFWDWYVIGGRWNYGLLVKEDCEDVVNGVPGTGADNNAPPAPAGYKWASGARKKDICAEEMVNWSIAETRANYENFAAMWRGEKPLDQYIEKTSDGLYSWRRKIFDPTLSIDDVLKLKNFTTETVILNLFNGFLDTINTKPGDGEYGYYESDFSPNWEEQFFDFWSDLDDDDVIITVDCHM